MNVYITRELRKWVVKRMKASLVDHKRTDSILYERLFWCYFDGKGFVVEENFEIYIFGDHVIAWNRSCLVPGKLMKFTYLYSGLQIMVVQTTEKKSTFYCNEGSKSI